MPRITPRKSKPYLIICGVVLTLVVALFHVWPSTFLVYIDHKIYDTLLKTTHSRRTTGRPVVVDIDEASLKQFGQWPWPRYRIGFLLQKIRALGASSVGVDIIFAEPDRTSLRFLRTEIFRDLNIDLTSRIPSAELLDNDEELATVLSQGPFVTSYQFEFTNAASSGEHCQLHPLNAAFLRGSKSDEPPQVLTGSGVICNVAPLSRAATSSGFLNVAPDSDGIFRRVPLIIRYKDLLYPSLALATAMLDLGIEQVGLEASAGHVEAIRLRDKTIPLDRDGNLLVHYRGGRGTFEYFSAADILNDRLPQGRLQDKIVILGTSAAGLRETRATPLDPLEPGPEIHATIVDNLLRGDFVTRPPAGRVLELALVLVLGFASTLLLTRAHATLATPFLIGGVAALLAGPIWILRTRGVFVSPLLPLITIGGTYFLLTALKYWDAEREVRLRTQRLTLTQDALIQGMASLAETRDSATGEHIQRTRHYMKALAEHLRDHPRFRSVLNDDTIELLFRLAPLHDVGKIGVRDHILLKRGELTGEEFEEMKKHTVFGSKAMLQAGRTLPDDSFMRLAYELALTHQEKWDGSGYPQGRKGEEIPLAGRLMAVADVYDALISRRTYKEPLSHARAVEIMMRGRGSHFDPDVLDAFLEIQEEFCSIARRFAEEEGQPLLPDNPGIETWMSKAGRWLKRNLVI
ncbi:MAG TPA: CHASE2 domain-containing protein [Candidatus Methylomirabilis sp.]|nr:CHASE2 domain-containing protein [Candidatus Methylomirabilis sp.]